MRTLSIILVLVATGCRTETRTIGAIGDARPHIAEFADFKVQAAPAIFCDQECPPARGGTICLSGRVFEATSLIGKGAWKAEPIGPDQGATVRVFDTIALIQNPTGTDPLAETKIYNEDGCFIVKTVEIPISGLLSVAVEDTDTASADAWAFTAVHEMPVTGQNSNNLEVLAVPMSTARHWGSELLDQGAMIMWFRREGGKGESGVTPLQEELQPDVDSGAWLGTTLFYFNDDLSGFDEEAKANRQTAASGMVAVRQAPAKAYGGSSQKGSCIQIGREMGFSVPGTLQIVRLDVEGPNTDSDPRNCGTCGKYCIRGESCEAGTCFCPSEKTECPGKCSDLDTDPANCGSCGVVCKKRAICSVGKCACPSEMTECQGACVNIKTDPMNCGSCGVVCNKETYCKFGECACLSGKAECPGGCVNLDSDPANCGACGSVCSTVGSFCLAGECIGDQEQDWVTIPNGSFTMGSPASESCRGSNETLHQVILTHDFAISAYEVTQEQFQDLMGNNPSFFASCGGPCPVSHVNWHEAVAYCNALSDSQGLANCYSNTGSHETCSKDLDCNEIGERCIGHQCSKFDNAPSYSGQDIYSCPGYRLPTEAEWEYAYRAGSTTAFHPSAGNSGSISDCGNDLNADKIGWYKYNSAVTYNGCSDISPVGGPACAGTHIVGQKVPNAWGLYDMAGNVYEWCHDWYQQDLGSSTVTNPWGGASGTSRVLRGGSWTHYPSYMRAAHRYCFKPSHRFEVNGFRPVRTLNP